MKILNNLLKISLTGILVIMLSACSNQKVKAQKTTTVKETSTSSVNPSENINTLMRSLGIQRFQKKIIAPNFELKNLNGKSVSLKDFRGKFILLNFMATWCMWCRKEMPHLQKLHNRYKDKDFVIIAVFSDREGARAVKPFIKKTGYTFTENSGTYNSALLDPTGRVTSQYRVTGTPTTYLIDKSGNAFAVAQGYRDWSNKESFTLIENLINLK
ncbi:MAG TPA: TlpA family protein disulfide reductase [Ignavibacteria bacterium]|nr:TlpA family protein disulfide reductase [Ignavibacteria bacterium]